MNTTLEVREDGQIWLIPDWPVHNTSYEYDKREPILVSNQEVAAEILSKEYARDWQMRPGIYPIPGLRFTKRLHCDEYHAHTKSHCFVAVISLPESLSEKPKQESQEAIWNYVDFLINDPALPPRSWSQIRQQLVVEFTITRNK